MVETPVVVHAKCAVTKQHVIDSKGGLYFASPQDLGGVTEYYLTHPAGRLQHAQAGRAYVEREYAWSAVLERFDRTMSKLFAVQLEVAAPLP